MSTRPLYAAIIAVTLPLAGCQFWFGGGGDDCVAWGAPEPEVFDSGLRNPQTGQCEFFGGGGGGGGCGDYDDSAAEPLAFPDWGQCYSECTGLDEVSCLAAPGCRAAYVNDCPTGQDCGLEAVEHYYFAECWAVAPSGPIQGGDCTSFDAQECSRHDDCSARHGQDWDGGCAPGGPCPALIAPTVGAFESCVNENGPEPGGCYGDAECATGWHCNAAEVCLPSPGGNGGQVCYGWCVPDDTGRICAGEVGCDEPPPSCAPGTVPEIEANGGCWTQACVPFGECNPPIDPGFCYGSMAPLCEMVPPVCPYGSLPGMKDGCYSGLCIPLESCEAPPHCEDIVSEDMCIERPECGPTYTGVNCTCDPQGCGCEDWSFLSCLSVPLYYP